MRRIVAAGHYRDVRLDAQRIGSISKESVPTPPRALLSLASAASAARVDRALARRRYEALIEEFREEIAADRFAAKSAVAALRRNDSLIPPEPSTWRGRLGRWMIVVQSKALWWSMRAFRMRDAAIESVWLTLESHVREDRGRDADLRRQMASIEERLRILESGGAG